MKKIYNLFIGFLAIMVMAGCEEETTFSISGVTPVSDFYAPENDAFFDLEASNSVVFEWAAATAEDNGVVLYEVVFDVASGDFSAPIYRIASDGNGLQRTLTLTYAELGKIAGLADIGRGATGTLKWSVLATRGVEKKATDVSRTVEVKRPSGFPTPDVAYIVGTATEAGDDLANALQFKKTGESTFEIYTKLEAGDYYITSGTTEEAQVYSVADGKMQEGGTSSFASEGVYRIILDFSNGNVTMDEINKVELYFSPNDEYMFELPYVGNGVWKAEDQAIEFREESWGRDERYKFRFTVNTDQFEWFGSVNRDNSRPDGATEEYWYMYPIEESQWDYTFKFATEVDNSTSDVSVIFNTSVPEYTHVVEPQ